MERIRMGASVQLQDLANDLVPDQGPVGQELPLRIEEDRTKFPNQFPFPNPDSDPRAVVRRKDLDHLIALRNEHPNRALEAGSAPSSFRTVCSPSLTE